MRKALVDSDTGTVLNVIVLPDDWTGAEGEWQAPAKVVVLDAKDGGAGDTWDGLKFIKPPPPPPPPETATEELMRFIVDATTLGDLKKVLLGEFKPDQKATISGKPK